MSQTSQTAPWAKISFWGPRIITNSLAGVAFGSRVAGDFGPRSDYDLAVVVLSMPDQKEIRRLNSTLKTKTGLPVDLFFATPHGIHVVSRAIWPLIS